jgi:hypothetical protein
MQDDNDSNRHVDEKNTSFRASAAKPEPSMAWRLPRSVRKLIRRQKDELRFITMLACSVMEPSLRAHAAAVTA